MQVINATAARAKFFKLLQEVEQNHEPLLIAGRHNNVVMISEEDWRSIQETLYLSSIPGMVESIKAAAAEPLSECSPYPGWE